VRAVWVIPVVAIRSSGSTTAMPYDLHDGTSICDMVARKNMHSTGVTARRHHGTSINNTLDLACLYTIVLRNPLRAASGPTPRK
jgi:hypothetical protein